MYRGMPDRSRKPPPDPNQIAKFIVDAATGAGENLKVTRKEKNPAAVALGRLGGRKGGRARAEKMSAAERSNIAKAAALARWKSKPDDDA